MSHGERILEYLENRKVHMEDFLENLVSMETPSHDPESMAPIFKFLSEKFYGVNFETQHFNGSTTGGYLIACPQNRIKNKPLQLLIGHCDTVWEKASLRFMPIQKANNRMTGPGVFDMKAGLTQMLFALETLNELNIPLEVDPVCLINSDEEIGSRESTPAIRRLAKISNRAYILEPPLGLEGKLKTTRKGIGRFMLTVEGTAAHAGLNPDDGASAILELSYQIQRLFEMNDPAKGISVNVGMIEGGTAANVIASMGQAVVDVRAPTIHDAQQVTEKILALQSINPGIRLNIEGGFGRMPMEATKRNRKLFAQAQLAAGTMEIELKEAMAGGGSDANTTSLYTATLDGLGTVGDGAHAAHEFIFLDKLKERTALLTLLLLLPAGKSN